MRAHPYNSSLGGSQALSAASRPWTATGADSGRALPRQRRRICIAIHLIP
jgi:hypothetical protein